MYYMSNTYNNINQAFSFTNETWDIVWFLFDEMFTSDFVPVNTNIISVDVVNNPRACAGISFGLISS